MFNEPIFKNFKARILFLKYIVFTWQVKFELKKWNLPKFGFLVSLAIYSYLEIGIVSIFL